MSTGLESRRQPAAGTVGTGSAEDLRADVEKLLSEIPIDFGGGCSTGKAYTLAWLIRRYGLKSTVDIGVYRGRSMFPQALAHRSTGGTVYGVDPWSAVEAVQHDRPDLQEKLDEFVSETDFEGLYQDVEATRERWGLADACTLVRETSADAVAYFEEHDVTFDLVHIDGNHDSAAVTRDVELYLPRLAKGGFIVLDDVSWDSVRPAYRMVAEKLTRVHEHVDRKTADFAVFRDGGSFLENTYLRMALRFSVDR